MIFWFKVDSSKTYKNISIDVITFKLYKSLIIPHIFIQKTEEIIKNGSITQITFTFLSF